VHHDSELARVRILLGERPVSVRDAGEDDIGAVAHVYVDSVQRSFVCVYPDEYLEGLSVEKREQVARERFSRAGYRLLVAETVTGKMVGFVDCGPPVLDSVPFGRQIYSLYVLPEFHRLGVGKSLFDACISRIVADGFTGLCLDTVEASPYRKFYDRIGGRVVGNAKHTIGGQAMDTIIYGWDELEAV